MTQGDLIDLMQAPRARRSDPRTSHLAAEGAKKFQRGHAKIILDALRASGPMLPEQIATQTGIAYHAVCRRLKEIEQAGLVLRAGTALNKAGRPCTLWASR